MPEYLAQLDDFETPRPRSCPQCQANQPLTAHGLYTRTIVEANFDGEIRVRRYLCEACRRTVSLLPEFALPYLRAGIAVIAGWLLIRLLTQRALTMLTSTGWIRAHRFLFAGLRAHLLGWPPLLVPDGRRTALHPAASPV